MSKKITSPDIFAYAVYRLQGAGQFVDIEEVYMECWRLSPSRFGLRKYQHPNTEVAAKEERHLKKNHPDFILKTQDKRGMQRGMQLTAKGVTWVRERLAEFERLAAGETKAPATTRASFKVISGLMKNGLVRAFIVGKEVQLGKVEVADLLNCAPDSPPSVWQQRIATLRSAAVDNERPDLVQFLEYVERSQPEWFIGR